jgi:endonuclease/exonuclease/phosphatase family metal-dependent hydrolase
MDLSGGANYNGIVTDIRRRAGKILRIVNIYNQRNMQSEERQSQKFNWQRVIPEGGTVHMGDINARSSPWDLRCCVQQNAPCWD